MPLTEQDGSMLGCPRQAGANAIELTRAMIDAGADVLEDFTEIGGLANSAAYVAEQVYRAMEKRRRKTPADQKGEC